MNISHPFSLASPARKSKSLRPCWIRIGSRPRSGRSRRRRAGSGTTAAAPAGSTTGINRFVAPMSVATTRIRERELPDRGDAQGERPIFVPMVSRCRKSCATTWTVGIPPDGKEASTAGDLADEYRLQRSGRVAEVQLEAHVGLEQRVVKPLKAIVGERQLHPVRPLEPILVAKAGDRRPHRGGQWLRRPRRS